MSACAHKKHLQPFVSMKCCTLLIDDIKQIHNIDDANRTDTLYKTQRMLWNCGNGEEYIMNNARAVSMQSM